MNETPKTYQVRLGFLAWLTIYAIAIRLLPWTVAKSDPSFLLWNFSPIYGIALFGAAHFRDRRWAYAVPLLTYLIGDLGILAVTGDPAMAFYPNQPIVYASIALLVLGGTFLRRDRSPLAIAGTGLAGSLLFYVTTNFGVWFFGDGTLYPHTATGLIACYAAGLPWLMRTITSCWLFSAILFSPLGARVLESQSVTTPSPDAEPAATPVAARVS
jgi:hypothetical protein